LKNFLISIFYSFIYSINSNINAARQVPAATVRRLRSKNARINPTTKPAIADGIDEVEYSIAGIVMLASTAYGM
jgi:hypothetical protein